MKRLLKELRMKFAEITKRITGLSCPIFGAQWNPPEAHCTIARRVIRFLEDRRVLYAPYDFEVPEHCAHSVLQIREMLTKELSALDQSNELYDSLKAMRTACRKFLDRTQDGPVHRFRPRFGPFDLETDIFFTALGELRGVFGIHLARLAAQHGLDVEDELAAILPEAADDNTSDPNDYGKYATRSKRK